MRALNASYQKGELSCVQRQGIITCIPKGDKSRLYIKNWRPISLLNVVYKIGSSCIANRLKTFLPKLINEDQTGFVKNRYIGDNIRLIYDTIAYLEELNLPGLLLNIDFEKAFDSVSWDFMFKILKAFGMREDFCKWVDIFYKNLKSCVLVNGQASSWFDIKRGCRQGDPLSPYLFILVVEILGIMVRENDKIKGIIINNTEHKLSQYVDDTEFLLAGDKTSFETCMDVLKLFGSKSGIHLNAEKTCAIWLGSCKNSPVRFMPHVNLDWNPEKFKVLGIWFTNDLTACVQLNYYEKLEDVKHLFRIWVKRQITPIGRIAVLKSLILSKLIHLWLLLPNPPDDFFDSLQKYCYKFVWNKKNDKISRKTSHRSIKAGGLGIPYLKSFVVALKLTWIRKLQTTNHSWKSIVTLGMKLFDLQNYGPEIIKTFTKLNTFWKEVFGAYVTFFYKVNSKLSAELLAEPVFYNKRFQIEGKEIVGKTWVAQGMAKVASFYLPNGMLISYEQFKRKTNLDMNFLTFTGIKMAITKYVKKTNITIKSNKSFEISSCFRKIMSTPKGSKVYYDILTENTELPKCCLKWNEKLNVQTDWEKCFLLVHKTSDVKLKWLQLRTIHRCLGTNVVLKQMGISSTELCSFCKTEKDSIFHMFWQCRFAQTFWTQFTDTINKKCINAVNFQITGPLVIIGFDKIMHIDPILYSIILLAKEYLYYCKLNNNLPALQGLLNKLKYRYSVEEYIARKNLTLTEFLTEWACYTPIFDE